jgi:hypothetical protein
MNAAFRIAGHGALLFASATASAQGFFAGGSIGTASQQEYEIGGPISMIDDSDDSVRVFGGYLISPIQGVVVSRIDLGEPNYAGPAFGGFTDRLSAEGWDISWIIGWTPGAQDRVSLFGTLGVFAWDQDVTYEDPLGTFEYRDEGTSFSYGIGTEFNFSADGSNAWGVHLEYQLFKNVGDTRNSGHENDRDVLSLGATYHFGGNFRRD